MNQATRAAGFRAAILLWLAYSAGLVLLGAASAQDGITPGWSTPAGAFISHYNDPSSFVRGALDIARTGWVIPADRWLIHLWPPGFMVLEGVVIRVVGEQAAFLPVLLILSAACCATWMLLLHGQLAGSVAPSVAKLLPAVPFTFAVTRSFMLSPVGVALGETFSISFFILAFLLLHRAFRRAALLEAGLAGVSLAAAAYFRSQFELLVTFLTAGAVLLAIVRFAGPKVALKARVPHGTVRTAAVALLVAHLLMAPWRIASHEDVGNWSWVQTGSLIAANSLRSPEELLQAGGELVVLGGGNLACQFEPTYCGQKDPAYFYRAFFRHPAKWILEKVKRIPRYWWSSPRQGGMGVPLRPSIIDLVSQSVLAIGVIMSLLMLWRDRRSPSFALDCWFRLSFYGCLAAVYTLAHFEARYFYLPKIFAVVACIASLAGAKQPREGAFEPNVQGKPALQTPDLFA